MAKACKTCGGTRLPNAQAGFERGTCTCDRGGRVRARLSPGGVGTPTVYDVEWPRGTVYCRRPTLWRAVLCLAQLRRDEATETLREALPPEFSPDCGGRAWKLRDVRVRTKHMDEAWPGRERNVNVWFTLATGHRVGWNENPSRGWSFPVLGPQVPTEVQHMFLYLTPRRLWAAQMVASNWRLRRRLPLVTALAQTLGLITH